MEVVVGRLTPFMLFFVEHRDAVRSRIITNLNNVRKNNNNTNARKEAPKPEEISKEITRLWCNLDPARTKDYCLLSDLYAESLVKHGAGMASGGAQSSSSSDDNKNDANNNGNNNNNDKNNKNNNKNDKNNSRNNSSSSSGNNTNNNDNSSSNNNNRKNNNNKRKLGRPRGRNSNSRDPRLPKPPMSSFMWFSRHHRAILRNENRELSFCDIGKAVGVRWQAATMVEKRPFETLAAEDKARYVREFAEHKVRLSQTEESKEEGDPNSKAVMASNMVPLGHASPGSNSVIRTALYPTASPAEAAAAAPPGVIIGEPVTASVSSVLVEGNVTINVATEHCCTPPLPLPFYYASSEGQSQAVPAAMISPKRQKRERAAFNAAVGAMPLPSALENPLNIGAGSGGAMYAAQQQQQHGGDSCVTDSDGVAESIVAVTPSGHYSV